MRGLELVAIVSVLVVVQAGGASAQEEPLFGPNAPARVVGGWAYTADVSEGQVEQIGELMFETSGAVSTFEVTSDDPRLGGTATLSVEWIGWYPPALVAVADSRWLVEDEVGAWVGSSRQLASMADEDPVNVDEQVILVGSGAYEGLSAYLILDAVDETFLGAIIPDEMPELPADWMEIFQAEAGDDPVPDD